MAVIGSRLNDSPEKYDNLLKGELMKFSVNANFWKDSGSKTLYLPSGEMYHNLFEYERGYLKGNLNFYKNLLEAISRARGVIERNDPQWLELYRLEEFFKKRLKSLPYAPFLELVKDFPEGNLIHQIVETVFKNERPLAALLSSDKDSYLERQKKDVFTYADSMEENLRTAFLNSFLAHFDAINFSPHNLKYRLRMRKAIEEYLAKQIPPVIVNPDLETEIIDLNISKLVTETLRIYPSSAHLQSKFERLLQRHFKVLQSQIEVGNRHGGLSDIKADYEKILKSHKANFLLKDWTKFNVFGGGSVDEVKAEGEVVLRFFQAVFDWLDKDRIQETSKPKVLAIDCKRLIELIESGDLDKALNELSTMGIDDASKLLARYNIAKREYHDNTIGFEKWHRVGSKISAAALDLLKKHYPINSEP